jgi:hypothetical protein
LKEKLMADPTLQYRHGILIGNWNEDQFGVQLAREPNKEPPAEIHFLSQTRGAFGVPTEVKSYEGVTQDTLTQFMEDRVFPRRTHVEKNMLFQHRSQPAQGTRFLTTHNASYSSGGGQAPTRDLSLTGSLHQKKMTTLAATGMDHTAYQRSSQFHTQYSDNHNHTNSVLAGAAQPRAFSVQGETRGRAGNRGEFVKSFDASFRKTGLRG